MYDEVFIKEIQYKVEYVQEEFIEWVEREYKCGIKK